MLNISSPPTVNPQEALELLFTMQDLMNDLISQMRAITETFVPERPTALASEMENW